MRPQLWGRSVKYSQVKENEESDFLASQLERSSRVWRLFWSPVPWISLTVTLCFVVTGLVYDARLRRYSPMENGYNTDFGSFLHTVILWVFKI